MKSKQFCKHSEIEALNNPAFTKEQLHELRKRTPLNEVQEKTDPDGFKYKTVSGAYMKKRLNIIFGWNWDFQIISKEYYPASKEVIVHGCLTIRGTMEFLTDYNGAISNGRKNEIIKEQFGKHILKTVTTEINNRKVTAPANIGNGYKSAATDAFKKCASEIGLCWDIYTQEQPEGENKPESASYPEDKIFERLETFMKAAKTAKEVEAAFDTFEKSEKIEQRHKDLLDFHMKRALEST